MQTRHFFLPFISVHTKLFSFVPTDGYISLTRRRFSVSPYQVFMHSLDLQVMISTQKFPIFRILIFFSLHGILKSLDIETASGSISAGAAGSIQAAPRTQPYARAAAHLPVATSLSRPGQPALSILVVSDYVLPPHLSPILAADQHSWEITLISKA